MLPAEYIAEQEPARKQLLTDIHALLLQHDKTIVPVVAPMMGKDMIIYKSNGMMKYALAAVKKYMSLHVLPMYMAPVIYDKYKTLLPKANFQKGCINFSGAAEVPLPVIRQLIEACAGIDLIKIRNEQLAARKSAKKK